MTPAVGSHIGESGMWTLIITQGRQQELSGERDHPSAGLGKASWRRPCLLHIIIIAMIMVYNYG